MVTSAARREAAAHLHQVYGVSQRRACQAIGADRSSVRYRRRRPDDGLLRSRLREIAAVRRRFGYRRLHTLLRREGLTLNHKMLRRIYAEERLQALPVKRTSLPSAVTTCSHDLSPVSHPAMSRVGWSFEPVRLGAATGRGA
jgi:putative transposase